MTHMFVCPPAYYAHVTQEAQETSYGRLFVAHCGERCLERHVGAQGRGAIHENRVCLCCIDAMQKKLDAVVSLPKGWTFYGGKARLLAPLSWALQGFYYVPLLRLTALQQAHSYSACE